MMRKRVIFYTLTLGIMAAIYFGVNQKKTPHSDESHSVGKSQPEENIESQALTNIAADTQQGDEISKASVISGAGKQLDNPVEKESQISATVKQNNPDSIALMELDKFVSDEDNDKALEIAKTLMYSDRVETRQEVAETLGWIGVRGLPSLTKMLGDPDTSVADSAFDQWVRNISDLNDDMSKVELLVAGLSLIEDKDKIEEGFMLLDAMPETLAVVTVLEIIERGDNVANFESALEQYEFTTGEEFTTVQKGEEWVAQRLEEQSE